MDKTKSKLAAFFDNDDEEPPFPQKQLDDAKLSQYANAKVKKSRREKEQEAADAKKREEEASAAQAYAEFLDAFDAGGGGGDSGGASGGARSQRKGANAFVKADTRTVYAPSMAQSVEKPTRQVMRTPSPPAAPKPKGKRAMDAFLEEIKREQAEREAKYARSGSGRSATAMAAYEGQSGSKDRGDPQTSNLFVANLPSHVTEQSLGQFFARVGPVNSVKIMWPRSDATVGPGADMTASRRAKSSGLNGFVSFLTRRDAEDALREFDGFDWGGSVLRVGWSKAVPINTKPLYISTLSRHRRSRSRSRSRSHSRDRYHHDRPRDRHHGSRRSRSPRDRSRSPRRRRSYSRSRRYDSRSRSSSRHRSRSPYPPADDDAEGVTDVFIRAVAGELNGHDSQYEDALRAWEKNNSKYAFLLQRHHRRHAYFKGLLESEGSFKAAFEDDGNNSVYSTDSEEELEREHTKKSVLGTAACRRFEAMLRSLSGKRGEMARCMAFCLEHAEAAPEVADLIVSSLLVEGTAVPRKVARLHLICDILHNSAAPLPSAWKFRQEFQGRLGIVFDHLANIYHSFPGRITADLFKKQITTVIDIWEDWIVFPPDFTMELRARLEGAPLVAEETLQETPTISKPSMETGSRFKSSAFKPAMEPVIPEKPQTKADLDDGEPMDVSDDENSKSDLDGEPVDDIDGESVGDDDVDGVPVDEDVDGEPVNEDVDGIRVDDDDVDGVPMDDLDGVPV